MKKPLNIENAIIYDKITDIENVIFKPFDIVYLKDIDKFFVFIFFWHEMIETRETKIFRIVNNI